MKYEISKSLIKDVVPLWLMRAGDDRKIYLPVINLCIGIENLRRYIDALFPHRVWAADDFVEVYDPALSITIYDIVDPHGSLEWENRYSEEQYGYGVVSLVSYAKRISAEDAAFQITETFGLWNEHAKAQSLCEQTARQWAGIGALNAPKGALHDRQEPTTPTSEAQER